MLTLKIELTAIAPSDGATFHNLDFTLPNAVSFLEGHWTVDSLAFNEVAATKNRITLSLTIQLPRPTLTLWTISILSIHLITSRLHLACPSSAKILNRVCSSCYTEASISRPLTVMSSPRTIALFGYGAIGKPIAEALTQAGATVVIFSRNPTKLSAVPPNAKLASVDYADETKLAALLKENSVDVVVSTLTTAAALTDVQVAVARAAKEAGVKLFLPSEFGSPTAGHTGNNFLSTKNAISERIQELVPTARITTGLFTEFFPTVVSDPTKPGEFVIAGKGDARFSLTSTSDIAGYVAHILTALPLSELENTILLLEGQSMSFNEAAALYNKKPTYISLDSVEEPMVKALLSILDAGWTRTGFDITNPDAPAEVVEARSGRSNALWPGHAWKQLKDVVPSLDQASPQWTYQ